ncbi:hypothetical protein D3874_19830 [Oleomonas cavernae]|uniref:Uncharacterized protein n=1 Tax=Oleomonas cavernae TaxID=2320859 RepID=A0A418WG13_9PROT|nr:hypothetical protein [Oleomonas cavernae]RJF88947.1 hypothetical protein D3874_19830 [Oleomonas cavernae]
MRTVLLFLLFGVFASAAQAAELAISEIAIIPIHGGFNTVEHFAADDRTATVIRAWRGNGNAHGHYSYLVLLPLVESRGTDGEMGVVAFDDGVSPLKDTASVSPFDGERVLGALRFARAKLDGVAATVVIRADLGESDSGILADHAPVDISIYRLEQPDTGAGTTPDVFRIVSKARPTARFCNADMALTTILHLPLPADYAGGAGPSGCGD